MRDEKRSMHNEVKSIYLQSIMNESNTVIRVLFTVSHFYLISVRSSVSVEIMQKMQVWKKWYSFHAPTSKIL